MINILKSYSKSRLKINRFFFYSKKNIVCFNHSNIEIRRAKFINSLCNKVPSNK